MSFPLSQSKTFQDFTIALKSLSFATATYSSSRPGSLCSSAQEKHAYSTRKHSGLAVGTILATLLVFSHLEVAQFFTSFKSFRQRLALPRGSSWPSNLSHYYLANTHPQGCVSNPSSPVLDYQLRRTLLAYIYAAVSKMFTTGWLFK